MADDVGADREQPLNLAELVELARRGPFEPLEYHLHNIFTRLGTGSRDELAVALDGEPFD